MRNPAVKKTTDYRHKQRPWTGNGFIGLFTVVGKPTTIYVYYQLTPRQYTQNISYTSTHKVVHNVALTNPHRKTNGRYQPHCLPALQSIKRTIHEKYSF